MPERPNFTQFEYAEELLEGVDTVQVPVGISSRRIGFLARFHEVNKSKLTKYRKDLIRKGILSLKRDIRRAEKEEEGVRGLLEGPAVERSPEFFEERLTQLVDTQERMDCPDDMRIAGLRVAIDTTSHDLMRARNKRNR